MRAKMSGHRRTESRRVARRHIPSRNYCPVPHADRVANTGHPRLSAGKRAAEWVWQSACRVTSSVSLIIPHDPGCINSERGVLRIGTVERYRLSDRTIGI